MIFVYRQESKGQFSLINTRQQHLLCMCHPIHPTGILNGLTVSGVTKMVMYRSGALAFLPSHMLYDIFYTA